MPPDGRKRRHAVFRQRFGVAASVALAVGAEAPDVDYILRFWDPDLYLAHHRGLTHSVLMAPVMAKVDPIGVHAVVRDYLSTIAVPTESTAIPRPVPLATATTRLAIQ